MDKQILKLVSMLHVGKMVDEIITKSLSDGLGKEEILEIVRNNVEIKEIFIFAFSVGVAAFKKKADEDGTTDWKDSAAMLLSMSNETIAEAIGDFVEGLLESKPEEVPAE